MVSRKFDRRYTACQLLTSGWTRIDASGFCRKMIYTQKLDKKRIPQLEKESTPRTRKRVTFRAFSYRVASSDSIESTLFPRMTCFISTGKTMVSDYPQGRQTARVSFPLTTWPIWFFCAGFVSSRASSRTILRKMSYPRRMPLTLRPPWTWMNSRLSINCPWSARGK
jgi:hypothetical protein